jgi:hypothetical protein
MSTNIGMHTIKAVTMKIKLTVIMEAESYGEQFDEPDINNVQI